MQRSILIGVSKDGLSSVVMPVADRTTVLVEQVKHLLINRDCEHIEVFEFQGRISKGSE